MGEKQVQPEHLEQTLISNQETASAEQAAQVAKKVDWIEKRALGDYGHVYDQFSAVYTAKARELTRELLSLRDDLDTSYILGTQEALLQTLQSRASLTLDMMKSNPKETDTYAQISKGIAFFQNTSVPNLLYQRLEKNRPEVAKKYLLNMERRGLKQEPNFDETTQHIYKNEINDKDWGIIVKQAQVFAGEPKDNVEVGVAQSIMALMQPKQKTVFVQKMLGEPNYQEILKTLVLSGYLKIAQVTEMAEAKVKTLDPVKDAAKIKEYQDFTLAVQDKEMVKAQEQVSTAMVKDIKQRRRGRHFGQSNNVRQLLTLKGLGGTLLALNGMSTVAANVLMNIHQPSQLLNNKALGIGLAMTVGGMELSNGFGNLIDKPTTNFAQLLDGSGRKMRRAQEQAMYEESFESEMLRHPKAGHLYYQFAEEINKAYNDKRAKTHSSKLTLTMEEIGLDWEKLEKDFRPLDKKEAEAVFSQWVSRMGREGSSNWRSVASQKEFIGKTVREKYGLGEYVGFKPEIRQNYLVQEKPKQQ